jgi:hypothetical protein
MRNEVTAQMQMLTAGFCGFFDRKIRRGRNKFGQRKFERSPVFGGLFAQLILSFFFCFQVAKNLVEREPWIRGETGFVLLVRSRAPRLWGL